MFRRLLVLFFVVTLAATPAVSFQKKINKPAKEKAEEVAVFSHLARADLLRAVQLAKTFTGEAPRAVATLAISRSILEKRKQA